MNTQGKYTQKSIFPIAAALYPLSARKAIKVKEMNPEGIHCAVYSAQRLIALAFQLVVRLS